MPLPLSSKPLLWFRGNPTPSLKCERKEGSQLFCLLTAVPQAYPVSVDTEMQHNLRCDKGINPAFATKTAGLPPYQEGDWDTVAPADKSRTISAGFAADFIFWISRIASTDLSHEYDFYSCMPFHKDFRQRRTHPMG